MSAQAYEKVFSLNRAMNGGEAEMFFDLPLDEHSDVILIPQSEYNSLLEWIDKEEKDWNKELNHTGSDRYASEIKGRLLTLEEIKERLTYLNSK
jgi:hypothetical protein